MSHCEEPLLSSYLTHKPGAQRKVCCGHVWWVSWGTRPKGFCVMSLAGGLQSSHYVPQMSSVSWVECWSAYPPSHLPLLSALGCDIPVCGSRPPLVGCGHYESCFQSRGETGCTCNESSPCHLPLYPPHPGRPDWPSPPSSGWSKHSCRLCSLKQAQIHCFCLWLRAQPSQWLLSCQPWSARLLPGSLSHSWAPEAAVHVYAVAFSLYLSEYSRFQHKFKMRFVWRRLLKAFYNRASASLISQYPLKQGNSGRQHLVLICEEHSP